MGALRELWSSGKASSIPNGPMLLQSLKVLILVRRVWRVHWEETPEAFNVDLSGVHLIAEPPFKD